MKIQKQAPPPVGNGNKSGKTATKTPAAKAELTLATLRAWYPFTLNRSAKDNEQRKQAEDGEQLLGLAMKHRQLSRHEHLLKTLASGSRKQPAQETAANFRELLQHESLRAADEAQEKIRSGLIELIEAARKKRDCFECNQFAVEALCEVAELAAISLDALANEQPDLARDAARRREVWPVLASRSRNEILVIQERLCVLQLGEGVSKPADVKASDSTARRYAEAVYETLSENQRLHVFIQKLYEDPDWLGTPVHAPKWATDCARLPDFKRENFPAWWAVAEAMLQDQCPDLVDRPEWANTTHHTICRDDFGNLRRGTAETRILDKIKDALSNLAPE